jgi:N-acetylmuramoyl-L-alanine amidase
MADLSPPAPSWPAAPRDGDARPRGADLRQKMLRDLVEENVAVREGRSAPAAKAPDRSLAKARAEGRRPWMVAFAVALAAGAALTAFALRRAEAPAPIVAEAEQAPAAEAPRLRLQQLLESKLTPIDPSVLGLAVRRIVLDPGHGGGDTGTSIKTLHEKDLTLDIGLKLRDKLLAKGFEVVMTRDADAFIDLGQRSELANQAAGDLFVSIHINWLPGSKARGVETYFVGTTEDPQLLALAQRENTHSGADLSDYRNVLDQLLNQIATEGRQDSSQVFASKVQQALFATLRPDNPELINRGVKSAPFVVLVGTQMPAILAEVACLSNEKEAAMLAKPLYRETIAEALALGIAKYADGINPSIHPKQAQAGQAARPSPAPPAPKKGTKA